MARKFLLSHLGAAFSQPAQSEDDRPLILLHHLRNFIG
jgi:hypothetical protein